MIQEQWQTTDVIEIMDQSLLKIYLKRRINSCFQLIWWYVMRRNSLKDMLKPTHIAGFDHVTSMAPIPVGNIWPWTIYLVTDHAFYIMFNDMWCKVLLHLIICTCYLVMWDHHSNTHNRTARWHDTWVIGGGSI